MSHCIYYESLYTLWFDLNQFNLDNNTSLSFVINKPHYKPKRIEVLKLQNEILNDLEKIKVQKDIDLSSENNFAKVWF